MKVAAVALATGAAFMLVGGFARSEPQAARCELKWRTVKEFKSPTAPRDVFAPSSSDVWVVGSARSGKPLIARWNGRRWRTMVGRARGELTAVSGASARDVWAVGWKPARRAPLVLHYRGHSWRDVSTRMPLVGTARAGDVAALRARDVWVSGKALVHWNGARWRVAIGESFTALAAVDRADVWAVGTVESEDPLPHPRIVHWDGRSWRDVRNGLYADLYGATAGSSRDVWAVGATAGTSVRQLVAHWNGRRWAARTLAHADSLNDVAVAARNDVWAVGSGDIVHWNGNRWKAQIVRGTELTGVAAISRHDVWAVGTRPQGGVVLHYACP